MITRHIWTIWTALSAVPRKAIKSNHSLTQDFELTKEMHNTNPFTKHTNSDNRRPVGHLWGWAMGCLLWEFSVKISGAITRTHCIVLFWKCWRLLVNSQEVPQGPLLCPMIGAIWPSLSPCTVINPILLTYLLLPNDVFPHVPLEATCYTTSFVSL